MIIAIAGGSGSGKTTLARAMEQELCARFGPEAAVILAQDHYYIDQSARFAGDGSINFDHPDSLDFTLMAEHLIELRAGRTAEIPRYDFATHKRLPQRVPMPARPFILVEGTLLLSQPRLVSCFDLRLFVQTAERERFSRRLRRDVSERGRTEDGVRAQVAAHVKPMHDAFVEPSRAVADAVLSGESPLSQTLTRAMACVDRARASTTE